MKPTGKQLARLFAAFFKIGAFTFGGGYAMIPLIQREAVQKNRWISEEDILEIVAIAESTPGPIAVNAATFVGYRVGRIPGAVCATLGVVLPSFAIILAISGILSRFQESKAVQYAFFGVRAGVLALIVKALWGMYRKCEKSWLAYGVMIGVFLAVAVLDIPVLPVLAAGALAGLTVTETVRRVKK